MTELDPYVLISICVSAVVVVLLCWHAVYAIDVYRRFHDESAARYLLAALTKIIVGVGLLLSSFGFPLDDVRLPLAGISIARGALLVMAIIMLIGDHDPRRRWK